ncbi:MAG TPA: PKD domain-containing protein, partial [Verrucomicrobiae bacterium]|nr:PKD domain-containing protein [Verrucomicrobiae bacterium]
LVKHSNRAPTADAGANITVPESAFVTLDGSCSFDPDNDAIASYAWTQISGPTVTLNGAQTATPSFTAPDVDVAGDELIFELIVTDAPSDEFCGAALTSAPQSVRVHIQYANRPPAIVAPSPLDANEGATVTLETSASDPDGNSLTFTWTQLSGPAVTLDLLDPANPTFVAPQTGCAGDALVFKVIVSDGFGENSEAEITVHVQNINNPPVADAGGNQSVPENANVALDASASSDADDESLSYSWIQVAGPAVTLSDSSIANPTFTAPIVTLGGDPGASKLLVFEVTITDECGATATDLVEIKVTNTDHSPVANAGGSQTVSEGAAVTLNGSQSSDPDADALSYSWVQIAGPTVVLSDAHSAIAQFTAPLIGIGGATLVFELTVSDSLGGVASDTATVAVLNINTPPDCGAAKASVTTLWPPNHAMISVNIVGVLDPDINATVTITGVTQDEPTHGLSDGDTGPDAIITGNSVLLRAERSGQGNGRVYHIHFTAADHEGSCSGVATVIVPHSKATAGAIDGGELFDSTQ